MPTFFSLSKMAGPRASPKADKIIVDNLALTVIFDDSARWPSPTPQAQPVLLSLAIAHDCAYAAANDDLSSTINYDSVCSTLRATFDCTAATKYYTSAENLLDNIYETCFNQFPDIQQVSLKLKKPKALLNAASVMVESSRSRTTELQHQRFVIEELSCPLIVGVNACEREERQLVRFSIIIDRVERCLPAMSFKRLEAAVLNTVAPSKHLTLEALASSVVRVVLETLGHETDAVTVQATKPSAILFAQSVRVEMTRTLADFRITGPSTPYTESFCDGPLTSLLKSLEVDATQDFPASKDTHYATVALGSNLGDRFAHIEHALRLLETPEVFLDARDELVSSTVPYVAVVNTSFLYETAPMYVTDQPKFINGACTIKTNLPPRLLLRLLKKIEVAVGRAPSMPNGPRVVDLDILTYDSEELDTRSSEDRGNLENLEGHLVIPHPRMAEREFVLRPLCDLIPEYVHPHKGVSVKALLTLLLITHSNADYPMYKVIPFPRYPLDHSDTSKCKGDHVPATAKYWRYALESGAKSPGCDSNRLKTYIMATLNATPDSFSDGAAHNQVSTALAYASSSVASGSDIIDIGGYSTRPGATFVTPEDEIDRVAPIITAIRALPHSARPSADLALAQKTSQVLISIDTFRPDVAEAAVFSGANCINDVYAFTGPGYPLTIASATHFRDMRRVARELSVPVVLMHARGDAASNKDYAPYEEYAGVHAGVVEGVRVELGERVEAAVRGPGGLRRWNVIVDPGIGFSKTLEGNLQILRHAADITSDCVLRRPPMQGSPERRNPLARFPLLIGPSRKSFLGAILEKQDGDGSYKGRKTVPRERGWATAAALTAAVQQGTVAVRAHDALEMGDVVRIADALWK